MPSFCLLNTHSQFPGDAASALFYQDKSSFFLTILSLLIILMLSHTVWETLNNQWGAGGDKAVAPSSIYFPRESEERCLKVFPFVVAPSFVKLAQRMPSLSRQARETGSRL